MSLEENKAIIRRFFDEVWNHGRVDILGEIIAASVTHHRNDGTTVAATVEEETEDFVERFAGFAEIRVTCDDLIAEGDRVAVRWTAHGEDSSGGETLRKVHVSIYRIEDGRISESWTCF